MSRMTMRGVLLVAAALFAGGPAVATPFYLRYDAEGTFPEQEGWTRHTNDPGNLVRRSVLDGIFRTDTSASASLFDYYRIDDPRLAPEAGEQLRVAWRMRTVVSRRDVLMSDVAVHVTAPSREVAVLFLGPDYVAGEDGPGMPQQVYPLSPGDFHEFVLLSSNMQTFELYVNGQSAVQGVFQGWSWNPGPAVTFGDAFTGLRSSSEWDYVEVQVVPEPRALAAVALIHGGLGALRKGGRR